MTSLTEVLTEKPHTEKLHAIVAGVRVPTGLLIGGQWQAASDGRTFPVLNPATGETLAEIADGSPDDGIRALAAASETQGSWAATSPRERSNILRRAFDLLINRADDFAAILTAEMGRPLPESKGEVAYGAEFLRWFSEQAAHLHGDFGSNPNGDFRVMTTRQPVGPSLLITPWNFPLAMGTRKAGAALAAGCTVIIKPAAQTPLTMNLFAEVMIEAGVPAGVISVITTRSASKLSERVMSDARLRKVSFTGSTGVGSVLLRQAADNVLRSSMELGGNGPFVVLQDADVEAAVEGAMIAKFRNGGQSCVAANRFIVHEEHIEKFTKMLAIRVSELVVGEGTQEGVTIGPLIDEKQRDRVRDLVDSAVAQGAQVITGGRVPDRAGSFYEPTVITGIPSSSELATEEIFGPVATIFAATDDEDAIRQANNTEFGLAAFLYTRDVSTAIRYAEKLEAGMVGINRGLVSEPGAPFGGVKASGLGREGGHVGIEEYQEIKYIALSV